jgi:hypothetical protein
MASRNSCINLSSFQLSAQKLWLFWVVTQVWPTRTHPRIVIPSQPQGKRPLKSLAQIWARSISRIKSYGHIDPFLKSYRPDLLGPSCDSRATPRKTTYGNSCTIWARANYRIKSFGPFKSLLLVLPDRTSKAPSSESIATPRETASGNKCINFSTFQQSAQKLWPF